MLSNVILTIIGSCQLLTYTIVHLRSDGKIDWLIKHKYLSVILLFVLSRFPGLCFMK